MHTHKKEKKNETFFLNDKLEYGFLTINTIDISLRFCHFLLCCSFRCICNFVVLHGSCVHLCSFRFILIVSLKWKIVLPLNLKKKIFKQKKEIVHANNFFVIFFVCVAFMSS